MSKPPAPRERAGGPLSAPQSTSLELRVGDRIRLATRLEVTSGGLLAIGGMVSMILLSSAAIVRAARPRRG